MFIYQTRSRSALLQCSSRHMLTKSCACRTAVLYHDADHGSENPHAALSSHCLCMTHRTLTTRARLMWHDDIPRRGRNALSRAGARNRTPRTCTHARTAARGGDLSRRPLALRVDGAPRRRPDLPADLLQVYLPPTHAAARVAGDGDRLRSLADDEFVTESGDAVVPVLRELGRASPNHDTAAAVARPRRRRPRSTR